MKRLILTLAVLLLAGSGGLADIPGPDGKRQDNRPHTPLPPLVPQLLAEGKPLLITNDSPDDRVHIRIPRKLVPLQEEKAASASTTSASPPSSRMVVAGISLSAAMVTGGIWLLRQRRIPARFGTALAALSLLVTVLGCGLLRSWIDEGPPPPPPIPGALSSGRVAMEFVDDAETITVQLPREMAAKLEPVAEKK